jgi:hypothetical protein
MAGKVCVSGREISQREKIVNETAIEPVVEAAPIDAANTSPMASSKALVMFNSWCILKLRFAQKGHRAYVAAVPCYLINDNFC